MAPPPRYAPQPRSPAHRSWQEEISDTLVAPALHPALQVIAEETELDETIVAEAMHVVKRAKTSYMCYCDVFRKDVVGSTADVARILGAQWGELDESAKAPYIATADRDKVRATAEQAKWQKREDIFLAEKASEEEAKRVAKEANPESRLRGAADDSVIDRVVTEKREKKVKRADNEQEIAKKAEDKKFKEEQVRLAAILFSRCH